MISANTGHVMTVANSIIGVGILAMPFCFQKCGVILSVVLLILNNAVTRVSCHYLIKSSNIARRKSFEFLAFHAFGPSGKLMVELCIIGYLIGTCIAYFVVVGDLGPQIVAKLLNINEGDRLRTWVMITVTFLCILPLAMLKNVDSLAAVCTASIGFYFCLVIKVIAESKEHIVENDWMQKIEYWKPSGTLQCLPIFSMALSCQMQLFEVLETVSNASLEKMNRIVKSATMICMWVYIFVGFFGYVAFCTQPFAGNILINFSPSLASDVIKMGFVLSVAFSFPLVIFPCRASIYSLLYQRGHADTTGYIPELRFKIITTVIVLFSLSIALLIPSIELVIGLVGSTIGVAICIMFPASCFMKVSKKDSTEKRLAQFILIGGFCLMILGTYANLLAIDEKRSGPSSVAIEQKEIEKITTLENLSNNIKPTELHQAEKPIELNPPKASTRRENINVKPISQGNKANKDVNLSPPQNVVVQNLTKTAAKLEALVINKNLPAQPAPNSADINKDAINREEEIVAEEAQKQSKQINEAKDELKKTQELLEKKVEELQQQIKQQNEAAKDLVEKKLENIVEKVEQIEREVHKEVKEDKELKGIKDKSTNKRDKSLTVQEDKSSQIVGESQKEKIKPDLNDTPAPPIPKGSLVNILTESLKSQPKQTEPNSTAFEPISYKTGEIMNKLKESQANDGKVPLPLPLLINASKVQETDKKDNIINQTNENKPAKKYEEPPKQNHIEAIRRDILQANAEKDTSTRTSIDLENYKREKRNAAKEICTNWDVELDDCLDKKSVDSILPQNMANLKIESIGRDLKSVKEKT